MRYVNTGAFINGQRAKSKKALKEALRDNPAEVDFDLTSPFDLDLPSMIIGSDFADSEDLVLSVVGPDPYRDRKWYASVSRSKNGALKVT